jgi:hypothetical protein
MMTGCCRKYPLYFTAIYLQFKCIFRSNQLNRFWSFKHMSLIMGKSGVAIKNRFVQRLIFSLEVKCK